MNATLRAARQINDAIGELAIAKYNLLQARSDQHIRLAILIAELEEIREILHDPECTPEIVAVGGTE